MLCQKCNVREACVHYTKIINGKKVEAYLCEECAKELNLKSNMGVNNAMNSILSSFFGYTPSNHIERNIKRKECPFCKMTYDDFTKTGKIGCAQCYKTFSERLVPVIKRLHGSTKHVGRAPVKLEKTKVEKNRLQALREELKNKVQNEEYEAAAKLRDKIRMIESKQGGISR